MNDVLFFFLCGVETTREGRDNTALSTTMVVVQARATDVHYAHRRRLLFHDIVLSLQRHLKQDRGSIWFGPFVVCAGASVL